MANERYRLGTVVMDILLFFNFAANLYKIYFFSAYSSPIIKRWYLIAMSLTLNMLVPKSSTQMNSSPVALSEPLTPPQGPTKEHMNAAIFTRARLFSKKVSLRVRK